MTPIEIRNKIANREEVCPNQVKCRFCGNWGYNCGQYKVNDRSRCRVGKKFTEAENYCKAFKKNT